MNQEPDSAVTNPSQQPSLDQELQSLRERKAKVDSEVLFGVIINDHPPEDIDDDHTIKGLLRRVKKYKAQKSKVVRKEEFIKSDPHLSTIYDILCAGHVTFTRIDMLREPLACFKKNRIEKLKIERDIQYANSTLHLAEIEEELYTLRR